MKINEIHDTSSGRTYSVYDIPKNKVNLFPVVGNSFDIRLRCKRSMFDSAPINPNEGTFRLHAVDENSSKTVLIFSSSREIKADGDDTIRLQKSAAEMSIDPGIYPYELVHTSDKVVRIMAGYITMQQSDANLVPKKEEVLRIDGEVLIVDNQIIKI